MRAKWLLLLVIFASLSILVAVAYLACERLLRRRMTVGRRFNEEFDSRNSTVGHFAPLFRSVDPEPDPTEERKSYIARLRIKVQQSGLNLSCNSF